ncbi:hypothetical protein J7I93_00395 [Bacillus sp. ISL-47]|uniref:DUF6944 family repetitive protein n=1 Tax=Bacillus sp. ISL-47 TaxID=2819130 RepID=UPI001BE7775C|nr:hypothetical protein [Bacillus sp. ISL-47]MBT2686635.1 hypothetical protein [Bacillus sp. ISL-47]MBT2707027.1 hypothetical protein [Pseudomonas sp. ISL-84]
MDNQIQEIVGSVIAAIGTILSAIASTPAQSVRIVDFFKGLDIVGNTLQATGNALEASGQGEPSLEKLGNEIQAAGNSTVIAGLVLNLEDENEEKLVITGNWLQALGGAVALGDEFEDPTAAGQLYNIYGNLLQSIGNSLQAIGGTINLREKRTDDSGGSADQVIIIGSWIQAVGSVLSVIGQLKEESQEKDAPSVP